MGLFRISASPDTAFQSAFTFTSAPVAMEFNFTLSLDDIAPLAVIVTVSNDSTCPERLSPFAVPIVTSPVFVPVRFAATNVPVMLKAPSTVRSPPIYTDPSIEVLPRIDAMLRNAVSVTINFP